MSPRRSRAFWLTAALIAGSVTPQAARPSGGPAALNLAALLDSYAAGRIDDALNTVRAAGDEAARALRMDWPVAGRAWIDANPAEKPRRLLVAAALILETENLRIERGDWSRGYAKVNVCELLAKIGSSAQGSEAHCLLNWATSLLWERGTPDAAERAWYLAAIAMVEGVRDDRFLHIPVSPAVEGRVLPRGLVDRALDRFPDDPELRLHQALAVASRFSITVDTGRITVDPSSMQLTTVIVGPTGTTRIPPRAGTREDAIAMFTALKDDPIVGAEARLRLGYLQWALGHDAESTAELRTAAKTAKDTDLRYLAHFLLGWTALLRDDAKEARAELTLALAARPHSQSASLALATLELREGDAVRGYELADATFAHARTDDDPWRLFLYGHHPHLPVLLEAVRRSIR